MQPQYITLPKQAKDITGQTFGRLTALGPVGYRERNIVWLCRCECGNTNIVRQATLRDGTIQSCGCMKKDVRPGTVHGVSKTRAYRIWAGIVQRCTNPKNHGYVHYGARGITICDEWRNSPKSFHDYVSQLPNYNKKDYSLDRINNDGNYEPGNVRWETQTEQLKNSRQAHNITFDGRTQCLQDWSIEMNIAYTTLTHRLKKGWSIESALTMPVKKRIE